MSEYCGTMTDAFHDVTVTLEGRRRVQRAAEWKTMRMWRAIVAEAAARADATYRLEERLAR